jgi:hypothetical protein
MTTLSLTTHSGSSVTEVYKSHHFIRVALYTGCSETTHLMFLLSDGTLELTYVPTDKTREVEGWRPRWLIL